MNIIKKIILLIIVLLLLVNISSASNLNNAIQYFSFDDLGNNNYYTNNNIYGQQGKIKGAYEFTGSSETELTNELTDSNEYSVSYWFRLHSSGLMTLFSDGSVISGNRGVSTLFNNGELGIYINRNTYQFSDYSTGLTGYYDFQWHHLTLTFTGDDTTNGIKIYMDGATTPSYQATASGGYSSTPYDFFSLGKTTADTNYFQGRLDDVRVYNDTLTTSEISQIYNSGLGTEKQTINEDNLVFYSDMNSLNNPFPENSELFENSGVKTTNNGKIINGFQFINSESDYIKQEPLDGAEYNITWSFWINRTDESTEDEYIFGSTGSGTHRALIKIIENDDGTYNNKLALEINDGSSTEYYITGTEVIEGTFEHYIITYESGDIKVYKNNVLDTPSYTSGSISGDLELTTNNYWGADSAGANNYDGTMDDIRMYQSILTSTQRGQIYNSGSGSERINIDPLNRIFYQNCNMFFALVEAKNGIQLENGSINTGFQFDGTDDYIILNHNNDLNNNDMTYNIWFKTREIGTPSNDMTLLWKAPDTGLNREISITISDSIGNEGKIKFHGFDGTSLANHFYSINAYSDGEWHMLSITKKYNLGSDNVTMYVDGELEVNDDDWGFNIVQNNENIFIGSRYDNLDNFDGKIDEISIYNRVLNSLEISELYNSGLGFNPFAEDIIIPIYPDVTSINIYPTIAYDSDNLYCNFTLTNITTNYTLTWYINDTLYNTSNYSTTSLITDYSHIFSNTTTNPNNNITCSVIAFNSTYNSSYYNVTRNIRQTPYVYNVNLTNQPLTFENITCSWNYTGYSDGSGYKFYINGVLNETGNYSGSFPILNSSYYNAGDNITCEITAKDNDNSYIGNVVNITTSIYYYVNITANNNQTGNPISTFYVSVIDSDTLPSSYNTTTGYIIAKQKYNYLKEISVWGNTYSTETYNHTFSSFNTSLIAELLSVGTIRIRSYNESDGHDLDSVSIHIDNLDGDYETTNITIGNEIYLSSNETGNYSIEISKAGWTTRYYYELMDIDRYIDLSVYLSDSSTDITFKVENEFNNLVRDAQISCYRVIDGELRRIAQKVTDYSGQVTIPLDQTHEYIIRVSSDDYLQKEITLTPTSSSYTIRLTRGGLDYTNIMDSISYSISPISSTYLDGNETYNFIFSVADSSNSLDYWGLYLEFEDGTNYTKNYTDSSGGIAIQNITTPNNNTFLNARFFFKKHSSDTWEKNIISYYVYSSSVRSYSLFDSFSTSGDSFSEITKILIITLLTLGIVGTTAVFVGLNPIVMDLEIITILGFFTFLGWVEVWITALIIIPVIILSFFSKGGTE